MGELKMNDEQKIVKIIGVAAGLAIIALIYGAISVGSVAEKINTRDAVFAGLGKSENPVPQAVAPAEITITLITDSNNQMIIRLDSLVQQLQQLPELKVLSVKILENGSSEA